MTEASTNALEKMAAVRDRFSGRLDERLQELDDAIQGVFSTSDGMKSMKSLEVVAGLSHKLRGAASTFGMFDLAEAANSLESHAKGLRSRNDPVGDQDNQELWRLFRALKEPETSRAATSGGDAITWERLVVDHRKPEEVQKTIYIVDSDLHFAGVIHEQLKHFGYNVLTINDHADLEEAMRTLIPAAIVIDVESPDNPVAGLQAVQILKDNGLLSCPVVYVSARDDMDARLGAARVGCDGYLVKPVDIIELVGLMDRYTDVRPENRIRVVVVDDDPDVAEFYEALLSQTGIHTVTVTNPLSAYGKIIEVNPDVILMDIEMPECSGFDLARVVRQNKSTLRIPIVFMSGSDTVEYRASAMEAGGDDFLLKNVEPQVLLASILTRGNKARELNAVINHLLESENRFRAVAETAQESIITTDDEGRVIYWNQGAEDTFGYALGEILGKPISSIMSDVNVNGGVSGLADIFRNMGDAPGPKKVIEATGSHQHGRKFPVELTIAGWEIGDHQYFTSIVRDTTERKKTERALSRAKMEAESANEAKSDFLASMSHELRTPLNAILGFAQLMQIDSGNPLSGSQVESVDQISRGGNYLLDLINEVLDLAKIESGKVNLSIQTIQPRNVLDQCLALVDGIAKERKIDIVSSGVSAQCIKADQVRFKQVLLNLMSNAVKYNTDGGTVTIESTMPSYDIVRFSVSDTGNGIPEDQLDDLFKPFYRLGAEATETEGTGIGLTVTKRLVEAMDGEIGLESALGAGSTFWIDLPLAADGEPVDVGDPLAEKRQEQGSDTGTATVLYIEDNNTNIQLMEMLFAQFDNRRLVTAMSAEDGLVLARDIIPDIVLMDINLPGMSGLEALAVIKGDTLLERIPVIAVTAAATSRDIEMGMEAGFFAYITKPFNVTDVVVTTSNALMSRDE